MYDNNHILLLFRCFCNAINFKIMKLCSALAFWELSLMDIFVNESLLRS